LFWVPRVKVVASLIVDWVGAVSMQSGFVTTPVMGLVARTQKRIVLARWSRA
jgi:hypothetical protein